MHAAGPEGMRSAPQRCVMIRLSRKKARDTDINLHTFHGSKKCCQMTCINRYTYTPQSLDLPFTPSASGICFRECCPSASGLAVCQSHSEQRVASWVLVQGYRGNGVGGVAVRVS